MLHYGFNNPNKSYDLSENNQDTEITFAENEKDLGVTFDTDLKFRQHINNCINKANSVVGIIKRSFLSLKKKPFIKLYKSTVRSILEYGNIIWSPRFNQDIQALERVQRRATKIVYNIKDLSYQERLKRLDLPSLVYRRLRGDLIECYKLFHNQNDIDSKIFFKIAHNNTRGHPFKVQKQQCRLDVRKNFFSK